MDYLTGFNIKPHTVTEDNFVLFTDGKTNDIFPSRGACEAYGYEFDTNTGTCKLKGADNNAMLNSFNNLSNYDKGGNSINSNNMMLTGVDNRTQGQNNNGFMTGKENLIEGSMDNAAVFGVNGSAYRQNEFVLVVGKMQ